MNRKPVPPCLRAARGNQLTRFHVTMESDVRAIAYSHARRISPPLPALPLQIVAGYARALQTALSACDALAVTIDVDNDPQLKKLVDAAVGTKFSSRWVDSGRIRTCGRWLARRKPPPRRVRGWRCRPRG